MAAGSQPYGASYIRRQWNRLSLFQVNMICLMIVLAMTGAVSWTDMLYPFASTLYIILFAAIIFPPVSEDPPENPFKGSKVFKYYVMFGAFIGLLVPSVFILLSFILGDSDAVVSAVPHCFLLIAQIVAEGFSVDPAVSAPVKVLIPASYNTKRLVTLLHWVERATRQEVRTAWTLPWQVLNALLALSNLAFWTYNLLGFLLPIYLPKQFRVYYKQEVAWKESSGSRSRN
eukprot:TRINITY_DN14884_c0_g1_i2.p1 TRINITY_DN14884_c0_g1~~TRINITY_DN14884_c0_g1_i2.p1  ORF type:complete len:230 (+),score=12.36 TRINITY_DN14884_c0_g1_i2:31-720(+)